MALLRYDRILEGGVDLKNMTGSKRIIYKIVLFLICIAVNCGGRKLAETFSLPGFFDAYGTFFAAYALGPLYGAAAGFICNAIFSLANISSVAYGLVGIFIGVYVGNMAKKGAFSAIFSTVTVALAVACGAMAISVPINIILFDGSTGNIWGDGVIEFLCENGVYRHAAEVIGDLYIEFPDKLLTAIVIYLIVKLTSAKDKSAVKDIARKTSAVSASILIMLMCFPITPVTADAAEEVQQVSYIQNVYNGSNGLLCGHANAITQSSDGVLWIGTYAGLYRYNGSDFVHIDYFNEVRNVNCLYDDDDERLWIGTNDNGVVIVSGEKVLGSSEQRDGLPSNTVRSIVASSDGDYYIGTASGIAIISAENDYSVIAAFPEIGYVSSLSSDKNGNVSAVNSEGTLYIINKREIITTLTLDEKGKKISCCNFTPEDVLCLGTNEGSIYEYKIEDGSLRNINYTKCSELSKINNIYPDVYGDTWICADNGIGYIDPNSKFTKQETGDFNYSIENMIVDYQGNLWFASSRLGLLQLSRSSVTDVFADAGIKPSVVNSTFISEGLLYVGADDGLIIIDLAKNQVVENELTAALDGSRIRCITADNNSNILICSYGAGLTMQKNSGEVVSLTDSIPELGKRVRVCYELSDGTLAVSTSNGIFFIKDGIIKESIPYGDEFGHAQALCFLQSSDGTLYAGTDGNGIAVIKDGDFRKKLTRDDGLTSEVILRMITDPADGSIYIVTSNSICHMEDGKIQQLNAFPYSNNYDVIIDNDGEILVTGSAGVYVMNKEALLSGDPSESILINSKSGLVCSLTANAWNYVDSEKNIYLSADRGVFCFNLDKYLLRQKEYRLKVKGIKLDDKAQYADLDSVINIDRDVTKIEFIPEIVNFTRDEPIISYKLEGFDSNWVTVSEGEFFSAKYTNLKPGDYTFRLTVRDEEGNILSERAYKISKEKAIYDNYWFRFYMLGVAVLFIGCLTWYVVRKRMQHTFELQQAKLSLALQQVKLGNQTIVAIAKTVDAKDVRTSKHSQRVSDYSALIAREYGFTEAEQDNIRNAALLHDIGKIGIPDSVLNKPGRLTDEEYAIMKTHVTRGAEILKDFTIIDHVAEGARYHHERYDGKGYPDKLAGEQIPLYGRIISIADAFDAMTANRVYRKRQDFDYVMGELHKGRGTQFDPELLDIFLKLIDDKVIDIDALYAESTAKDQESEKSKE